MIRIGVVGYGYWGPNYVRILARELPDVQLVACADQRVDRLRVMESRYPEVHLYDDHRAMLEARTIDAVVIATPTSTHRSLAEDCLRAGCHVLVEKPMASTSEEAVSMIRLARENRRTLMVGHTFLFNPAVRRVKQYLEEHHLGDVLYFYFHRTGLGPIRHDVNALWDLAPHDLSMVRYWVGQEPVDVMAQGEAYLKPGTEDVVFLTLRFPDKVMAHVHVSWLDPVKTRRATIVGDHRMIVFDDTHPTEKLRIYDKGASYQPKGGDFAEFVASVRDGDIIIPKVETYEPLKEQLAHFVACITTGARPLCDGDDGLAVLAILERAQRQLIASTRVEGQR